MQNNFLAINKEHLGKGLKSIDILILAQIEEFQRNQTICYMTNEQFSTMFGESVSTVKRSIDKLEEMKFISRKTDFIEGNGRATRFRVLTSNRMEGSNVDNGRFKSA